MAKAKLSSYLKELHGRTGNYIYYYVKGRQLVRSYAVPRNPRTAAQQKNRCIFTEAVRSWQELSPEQKMFYNRKARNRAYTGYNLFISITMKSCTSPYVINDPEQVTGNSYFNDPCIIRINSVPLPYFSGIVTACVHKPFLIPGIPGIHDLMAA